MQKTIQILVLSLLVCSIVFAQHFEMIPSDVFSVVNPLTFRQILPTTKGTVLIATSLSNLGEIDKMQLSLDYPSGYLTDNNAKQTNFENRSDIVKDLYSSFTGIKLIAEGPGKIMYIVSDSSHLGCINYNYGKTAITIPPFNFPESRAQKIDIRKIWIDQKGNLFIGTNYDTLYIVEDATNVIETSNDKYFTYNFLSEADKDGKIVITEGAKRIKKVFLGKYIIPCSFAADPENDQITWIGTNHGLYKYDNSSGQYLNVLSSRTNTSLTVTNILVRKFSASIWFSTLEKGMGKYSILSNSSRFFGYKKNSDKSEISNPIQTFCPKSLNEFFVAPLDSTPAIFNTETENYRFITDTEFNKTKNSTTDIKFDAGGNLYIITGGNFFWSKNVAADPSFAEVKPDSTVASVLITDILVGSMSYSDLKNTHSNYEILKEIRLKYYENNLGIFFTGRGFSTHDTLVFAWKLDGFSEDWVTIPFSMLDEKLNTASLPPLKPGKYIFHAKVKKGNGDWRKQEAQLIIIIDPPFWQTWWFWLSVVAGVTLLVFAVVKWRVTAVRKQERIKAKYEKEALALEAKALRAQMNPHFIFNCMNSIKSLMQKNDQERGIIYLTTFSKLLRTIFQNSDKREITLFDELETCSLYIQLESMRFGNKFSYHFDIDESLDLKSVKIPALIIQPFIENAIWHGIMPKEEGGTLNVILEKKGEVIHCIVDDDGIGREMSKQNKFTGESSTHQSKGVHLTQNRLDLDNELNQRNALIEILDKKGVDGNATGTTVTLTFTVC